MPASVYELEQMAEGLRRAKARQAPKGYETRPHWTAAPSKDPVGLLRMYKQREQDRLSARRRDNIADFHAMRTTSLLPLGSDVLDTNMGGFIEGVEHNDAVSNIDPISGTVAGPNRAVEVRGLTNDISNAGMSGNKAYALMAMRGQMAGETVSGAAARQRAETDRKKAIKGDQAAAARYEAYLKSQEGFGLG